METRRCISCEVQGVDRVADKVNTPVPLCNDCFTKAVREGIISDEGELLLNFDINEESEN